MKAQIHKGFTSMGCSGDLNLNGTVHLVNAGTSCMGHRTGLAATEVIHEGRESHSSRRYGRHTTRQRTLVAVNSLRK